MLPDTYIDMMSMRIITQIKAMSTSSMSKIFANKCKTNIGYMVRNVRQQRNQLVITYGSTDLEKPLINWWG